MYLIACAMLFPLSVPLAGAAQAQNGITINKRNVAFAEIVKDIEAQTSYTFMLSADAAEAIGRVSVSVQDATIRQVLDRVLAGKHYSYQLDGNVVVIRADSRQQPPQQTARRIGGIVRDDSGNPLAGVTVWVAGTQIGTATDVAGQYSLTIPADAESPVLRFSMIGMESQDVAYTGQDRINVSMKGAANEIAQVNVVSTGMFTRNVQTYTGAVTQFNRQELKQVGNTNVLASLATLDPSFIITESLEMGSDPNTLPDVSIRGTSTLADLRSELQSNLNQPLYILNGFEASVQKIYDLDIDLVESITILKDAAAKAIYGAKAANGVVVIETVKPQQGNLRVSYNGALNITTPDLNSYNLTDASEKLEAEVLAGIYTSYYAHTQAIYDEFRQNLEKEIARGVDTYWMSKPLRVGVGQRHSLYFDGGDDAMQYSANVSYNNTAGVMKESKRTTISGGVNLSYRYKNFRFQNQLTVDGNKAVNSPYGSFSQYSSMEPYWRVKDENGNLINTYSVISAPTVSNPLYNASLNTRNESTYTTITENFYGEWDIVDNLRAVARFGYTQQTNEAETFKSALHTDYADIGTWSDEYNSRGEYTQTNGKSQDLSADVGLSYSLSVDKHLIYANAMYNVQNTESRMTGMRAVGFPSDRMDFISFGQGFPDGSKPSGSESTVRSIGFVFSTNYSYDNRYLLDVSYRLTGSSQFGADKRWGSFWSVGLGWNLHNEQFMESAEWLDRLKLRGSIGYTGSQNFSAYQAIMTYTYVTNKNYDGDLGAQLMGLANQNLKWQQQLDRNIGFDLTLFRKLSMNVNFYSNVTNDLLSDITLAPSVGFATYKENLGKTENKGFEVAFNYNVFSRAESRTHASVFFNVAHNTNKVVKISDALKAMMTEIDDDESTHNRSVIRYEEGQSMTAIWAVKSKGIDPATGQEVFVKRDGTTTYTWDVADRVVCGDAAPKARGNVGGNLTHQGFELNLAFTYSFGGQIYNQTLVDKVENANIRSSNVDRRVLTDRWNTPGQEAKFKSITDYGTTNATSRFVEDQNEFVFTAISLGYDFSQLGFIKRSPLSYLKVSLNMNDIARISTVKREQGLDYPRAHVISMSVSARF